MALEERIQQAIENVIRQMRTNEDALHGLAATLSEAAAEDRASAVRSARTAAEQEAARAINEALSSARAQAGRELASARAQAVEALSAARAEAAQALAASVADALAGERQADLAATARLLDGVRSLDRTKSLSEVLDALTNLAAREAARVAVLLVRGDRLRGWRLAGFQPATDPEAIDCSLAEAGVVTRAVRSGEACATSDQPADKTRGGLEIGGLGFAQLPPDRVALAVPVQVGGQVVAVVYADGLTDRTHDVPSAWPEVVEILARHAARCLEALTAAKAATVVGDRAIVT